MRRIWNVGVVILAATATLACQNGAASSPGLSDADRTTLRQNEQALAKALVAGDMGAVLGYYAADASLLAPNMPALNGHEAIQKFMASVPIASFKLDVIDVDGGGDVGYIRSNYALTAKPAGGGTPAEDHGKSVEIWRKQADGSWKIKWDIFNSDVAVPAPPTTAK